MICQSRLSATREFDNVAVSTGKNLAFALLSLAVPADVILDYYFLVNGGLYVSLLINY